MSAVEITWLVLRLGLAAVLGRAAVAKLARPDSARDGATQLGLPARLAGPVAVALPVVEAGVAVGLAVTPAAPVAAIAAAVLLAAFTALIGVNLARGRRPVCNCFGADGEPISALTLARNVVLTAAAVALVVAVAGDGSLGAYGDLSAVQAWALGAGAVVAAVTSVAAWVVVHLMRQNARLLERIEVVERIVQAPPPNRRQRSKGLPPGTAAPAVDAIDRNGQAVALGDLLDGRPLVLVFVEPGCGACVALGDELALRHEPFTDRRVVVVSSAAAPVTAHTFGSITAADVLADPSGETARRYGVVGTPSAVVVTPDGRIARSLAEGRYDARRLLEGDRAGLAATPIDVVDGPKVDGLVTA